MVNRPRASVVCWRDTWVSTEIAWTMAPESVWLSGPKTVPVMISVVEPTWAVAGRSGPAALSSSGSKTRQRADGDTQEYGLGRRRAGAQGGGGSEGDAGSRGRVV